MALHDFEKLNSIDIYSVLQKLGIEVIRNRKALCYMHQDHNPSMTIYGNTNSWFCFTCNKGGNVINLVKSYFKCDTDVACKWLEVEFGISPRPAGWKWTRRKGSVKTKLSELEKEKIEVDSEILQWIIAKTDITQRAITFLRDERKIKKEVYESLNIKAIENDKALLQSLLNEFCEERLLNNRIIEKRSFGYTLAWKAPCLLFPFYNVNGRLVNIQSRYLKSIEGTQIRRFSFVKDSKTSLYNAQLLSHLKHSDNLLLTEGVTDCLAALSFGINAVAITGASAFKNEYIDLLKDFSLFICPDDDKPGGRLMQEIKEKMQSRCCTVRQLRLADGSKDIGDYYGKYETLRFG